MAKISTSMKCNHFCPQSLFLYGTYREDGTPNFGLFCWFSYYWDEDLGVMVCIGDTKLTKDLIRKNGVFSANLVTKPLLPLADYYGNHAGYDPEKMKILPEVMHGAVLDVPILKDSPWSYELRVKKELNCQDGDIFLCEICNVLADEYCLDESIPIAARMQKAGPVVTTHETYFSLDQTPLGGWGEPQMQVNV